MGPVDVVASLMLLLLLLLPPCWAASSLVCSFLCYKSRQPPSAAICILGVQTLPSDSAPIVIFQTLQIYFFTDIFITGLFFWFEQSFGLD